MTGFEAVIALASSYHQNGDPDYGAFQEYVIARYEGVTELPTALCPHPVLKFFSEIASHP